MHATQNCDLPSDNRSPPVTVLAVDDHPMVLQSLQLLLRAKGFAARAASSGEAAVEYCRSHPGEVGIVITDSMMPGMDGRDTIMALRTLDPHLEFIAMSGGANSEEIAQLWELGITAFLQKPFTIPEIMAALAQAQTSRSQTSAPVP
jgi:CheY-like chemotaxis protein